MNSKGCGTTQSSGDDDREAHRDELAICFKGYEVRPGVGVLDSRVRRQALCLPPNFEMQKEDQQLQLFSDFPVVEDEEQCVWLRN